MQAEIYRGPKTGLVVASAVLAIAFTIVILIVAGSAGDSSQSSSISSSQSREVVQLVNSEADTVQSIEEICFLEMNQFAEGDADSRAVSIEGIRFREMNELPELSGDFAGIAPGAEFGNLSLQQLLFLEQNLSLPGDAMASPDVLTYDEITFLEENIWER